jgi:DNA-binding CsgD family transcriptional regulator
MLVGRNEEIAALNALFHDSAQGNGAVVVIHGAAAIGKTALLKSFAEQVAGGGALFLGAAGARAERGLPLGIMSQLFRSAGLSAAAVPEMAELVETRPLIGMPEDAGSVMEHAIEGLLSLLFQLSEGKPVVLAVYDLQYADSPSLEFLSCLARRVADSRILIVFTECSYTSPVDRLVRAKILRQACCHSISLAPLPLSGVTMLLSELLDSPVAESLASACYAMTGGNPLLVHALAEDSWRQDSRAQDSRAQCGEPETKLAPARAFRSAVVTCLDRYEPRLAELAQATAVLGENALPGFLGELLGMSPGSVTAGIDALAATGLLASGRFRHETARHAVLEHMTADERAVMNGRAARILHRTDAAPEVVAGHLLAGHPLAGRRIGARWTVPLSRDAADRPPAGDPGRAVGYLTRAETEAADDRRRAATRFARACAEWCLDPEAGARHMVELVPDARAGLLDGECMGRLAYHLLWAGSMSSADQVLAAMDQAAAPRASTRSALVFLYPDLAGRAAFRDDKPPDDGAVGLIAAETALSDREDNDYALASITTPLMALICADRLDRAAFWCETLRQESESSGGIPLLDAVLAGFWSMIETRRGNLPFAENHACTALTLLPRKGWGVAVGQPLSSLLLAAIAVGRHDDAAAYLRVPVPKAMFRTPYGLLYLNARGEYYLATGRFQEALADFEACGELMISWELDWPGLVPWRIKVAEAYLAMGDEDAARKLSQDQLDRLNSRSSRARGISLRVLARIMPPQDRIVLLRESAEALRDSGARLELAYTFIDMSNAHLAIGEHDRANWASCQSRSLVERCGVPANLGRRDRGDDAGRLMLARLSNAERRVATLAAYGYTNCQIANKLYITVSTVEQHLTRVYRKLGVRGRVELPIEI